MMRWRGVTTAGAVLVIIAAITLLSVPGITYSLAAPEDAPLAQATATPTSTPTPTPTATPTLPPAHVYSDATTGAVWQEQSFPRAGINCIVQAAGQAAGQFSCVPGTPVP